MKKFFPVVVSVTFVGTLGVGVASASGDTQNLVSNPSFESSTNGVPTCWQRGIVGDNSAVVGVTASLPHSGQWAGRLMVSNFVSGNAKLVVSQKSPGCAPSATPGKRYDLSLRYRSTVAMNIAVYYRDAAGNWHWWLQSPRFGSKTAWTTASYRTPSLPTGATALSFGPALSAAGSITIDDVTDTEATPAPAPTVSSTSAPTPSGTPAPATSVSGTPTPTSSGTPATTPAPTNSSMTTPPALSTTVVVSSAQQLQAALDQATPGTSIKLADGTFTGHFSLARAGTASAPIVVYGTRAAVIDGGSTDSGYAFHLDGAKYVTLHGFTIRGAQKSLVLDETNHAVIDGLDAGNNGEESILLRNFSSDNEVENCEVHDTGLRTPGYGEGVYIGLAYSNWSSTSQSRTGGQPDASNRNVLKNNYIHDTGAESIDIKEGTADGQIIGNRFDGRGMSGQNYADSWIDIAGNGYVVTDNVGQNALVDGIQTHRQGPGVSASSNVFQRNSLDVNGPGYGINIDTGATGNAVSKSNTVQAAGRGLTNVATTN